MEEWFVVIVGKKPGIYQSMKEVNEQIKEVMGGKFKAFTSKTNAEMFFKNLDKPKSLLSLMKSKLVKNKKKEYNRFDGIRDSELFTSNKNDKEKGGKRKVESLKVFVNENKKLVIENPLRKLQEEKEKQEAASRAHIVLNYITLSKVKAELNETQKNAIEQVLSGQNIFITGSNKKKINFSFIFILFKGAGTGNIIVCYFYLFLILFFLFLIFFLGKSFLLNSIIKLFKNATNLSKDQLAVTASTGIASFQLGGETLHSW